MSTQVVGIGSPIPDVELTDLATGRPVALRSFLHGPALLFVWASW